MLDIKFNLSFGKRLLLLFLIFIFCFIVVGVISGLVLLKFEMTTPVLRILTVLQDMVMFITPAVACAMLSTRYPARLLAVDRAPGLNATLTAIAALLVSMPAMNQLIALNESMHLPESMAGLEQWIRAMEDDAAAKMNIAIGAHNIPSLVINILIIGVMAGVSEELFFRGALQRLLSTRLGVHASVWTAAVIFSAVHMQFYGFVPRMLLGAFFGYALVWSGTLWLPVILHVANNTIYLIAQYRYGTPDIPEAGFSWTTVLISLVSVVLTAVLLASMRRSCLKMRV